MDIRLNVTVECQVCGWSISYKKAPNLEAAQAWFKNHVDEQHPPEGKGKGGGVKRVFR